MEKMSRMLIFVASITLALVCVANSKVLTTGELELTAGWCYCNASSEHCKPCKPGDFLGDQTDATKFYMCGSSKCFQTFHCQNHTVWDQKNHTCIHAAGNVNDYLYKMTEVRTTESQSKETTEKTIVTGHGSPSTDVKTSSQSHDTTSSGKQTTYPAHSTQSPTKEATTEPSHHSTDAPTGWCYCNASSEHCKPCKPGDFLGDQTDATKFYMCDSSECFETFHCLNHTVWDQKNHTCIHADPPATTSVLSSYSPDFSRTTPHVTKKPLYSTTSKATSYNNGTAQRLFISIYALILVALL